MDEAKATAIVIMSPAFETIKRIVVAIIGTTVLVIGILLLVLPGPAFIVIPLGLGILATEFMWARRLLSKFKEKLSRRKNPR